MLYVWGGVCRCVPTFWRNFERCCRWCIGMLWNLNNFTQLKVGKSSEPKLHDFRFQPLISRVLPACGCWADKF